MIRERELRTIPGIPMLIALFLGQAWTIWAFSAASAGDRVATIIWLAEHLKREIQDRLAKAGVEVLEARISHLAYAPEIAAAMLQRQQAGAIIAARQKIVEGAVGMVEMALDLLSRRAIVQLDDERKAAMVSNLLVVLCGAIDPARRQHRNDLSVERADVGSETVPVAARQARDRGAPAVGRDDLRSLNAQIEYLLRNALKASGRLPKSEGEEKERGG